MHEIEIVIAVISSVIITAMLIVIGFILGRRSQVAPPPPVRERGFDPGEEGKLEFDPYAVAFGEQNEIRDLK